MPRTALGDLLRRRRKEAGLTLAEVGEALGLANGNFVGMVERGERLPSDDALPDWSRVLGLPLRDLLALKYEASPSSRVGALLAPPPPEHPRLRRLLLDRCDSRDVVEPEFDAHAFGALERLAWGAVLHGVLVPAADDDPASPLRVREQLGFWRARLRRDPNAPLETWWFEREADLVVPWARSCLRGWDWDAGRLTLTVQAADGSTRAAALLAALAPPEKSVRR